MNTTEIQKVTPKEKNQKKEKRTSFLKVKKLRDNSKPKPCTLGPKKRFKKKLFFIKSKKEVSQVDDISLETDSTIITLDEESNIQNEGMNQYLDEIELALKDIHSKGIHIKNLNNFIKEETPISGQNKEIEILTENLKNEMNSICYDDKINLVLDIDETLVYSKIDKELKKDEANINDIYEDSPKDDIYYIRLESIDKVFIYKIQVRKNMADFFKKLTPYCKFYINSMACPLYVSKIVAILYKNYGLMLSNGNENNIICTSPLKKKCLPEEITKNNNFLILDDNLCAWEVAYIPSIIPVQKFRGLFDSSEIINNVFYQYYLFTNKIYTYDEFKRPFLDKENKVPYCAEVTTNEKSQLHYISEIIKKSILLSKLLDFPIRHALHLIQNTILKECFIYYDGYDKDYISEIINLLGGSIVKNIQDATHIIYNKNLVNGNIDENVHKNKYVLDIKWIFDCFFYYTRCNEYSCNYKLQ